MDSFSPRKDGHSWTLCALKTSPSLGNLILVRLLGKAKTPPSRSNFVKDLEPYFPWKGSEWDEQLDQTLAHLKEIGLIESKPFRLTDQGRQTAGEFLGLDSPPNATWTVIRDRYLFARALEIPASNQQAVKDVGTSKGARPAVLVKYFDLPGSPVPSESRVRHLLAWQQLSKAHDIEVPATQDINHNNILWATLLKGQKGVKGKTELNLLAAQVTKAINNDLKNLRIAVIRQWLEKQPAPLPVQPPQPPEHATSSNGAHESHTMELPRFAQQVKELAQTSPTGRFGENKVFLSHVWNQFQGEGGGNGMTRSEFDRLLVEANRENLITLSRADLVSAMNPNDVQSSEIRLPNSTFHFIRTDR